MVQERRKAKRDPALYNIPSSKFGKQSIKGQIIMTDDKDGRLPGEQLAARVVFTDDECGGSLDG